MSDPAVVLAWVKEQKRKGLCARCTAKAVEGKTLCEEHAVYQAYRSMRYRQGKKIPKNAQLKRGRR